MVEGLAHPSLINVEHLVKFRIEAGMESRTPRFLTGLRTVGNRFENVGAIEGDDGDGAEIGGKESKNDTQRESSE